MWILVFRFLLLVVFMLAEEGEVHTAVSAVFEKVGACGEVVVFPVFQHDERVVRNESAVHNALGEFAQLRQGVGRVGKDEVKGFLAALDEAQRVRGVRA